MVVEHRFLADSTLGKLSKWLRILGMDAEYLHSGTDTGDILKRDPDRILLTRSRRIAEASDDRKIIFIRNNDPVDQLKEVIDAIGIRREHIRPFSRCIRCNILISRVEKASVKSRIPDYIWDQHQKFHQCGQCGRIYWAGTHIDRSLQRIDDLFDK